MFNDGILWVGVHDGDPRAFAIMRRHYTFQAYADGRRQNPSNPNRFLFAGPGEKMVLITPDCLALFVWRKFINKSGQDGVNCAVFRNDGPYLSSELINQAEVLAAARWPGERAYTYVNAKNIQSTNPGYCFLCAGWKKLAITSKSRGLIILEKILPANRF